MEVSISSQDDDREFKHEEISAGVKSRTGFAQLMKLKGAAGVVRNDFLTTPSPPATVRKWREATLMAQTGVVRYFVEFCELPHELFPRPIPRLRVERDFQIGEPEDPVSADISCARTRSPRARSRSASHRRVRRSVNIRGKRNRQCKDQYCIDGETSCREAGAFEAISTTPPPLQFLHYGAVFVCLSFSGCCKCCGDGHPFVPLVASREPV